MAMFKMRNLAQYGVITDLPESDLPVNAFTDALNVRFDVGKISSIGGWDMVSSRSALGDQTPLAVVKAPLSNGHYFYASNKFIYSIFPNVDYDPLDPTSSPEVRYNVTPRDTSGDSIPDYDVHTDLPLTTKVQHYLVEDSARWQSTMIADRIVFNNPSDEPISQADGSSDPKAPYVTLKGWGVPKSTGPDKDKKLRWRAERIHAFKDHLMALNMTESVSFDQLGTTVNIPNRVRWSTYAYENQVPQSWYEDGQDEDGNFLEGGFVDLMDATSPIVDGSPLRDYFMVYTNTETYLFTYTGGQFVFSNAKVFSDAGLLAPGCVAEYDGQHICVTADDVIIHDGSQKRSIIQGVIRDRLLSEISSVNPRACRVYTNPIRREVWITYPYDASGAQDTTRFACNRAAVFNFTSKTWTFAELPDIYDAAMGELVDKSPLATWENGTTVQPTDVAWDASDEAWEINSVVMGNNKMFAASGYHCLLNLDVGQDRIIPNFTDTTDPTKFDRFNLGKMVRYVERKGLDMDEAVDEYVRTKTWRTMYPQLGGDGTYIFTLSGYDIPGAMVTNRMPSKFTVGINYKVDCFFTKRWINYRVETNDSATWSWSTMDVDYFTGGRR